MKTASSDKKDIYADIFTKESGNIELKLSNFHYNKKTKKLKCILPSFKDRGFIFFYAPWCKHCLKLSTPLSNLAIMNATVFPFGAVNSEDIQGGNDFLCNYADIEKYPSLYYVDMNGTLTPYLQEYVVDNFIYFINMS